MDRTQPSPTTPVPLVPRDVEREERRALQHDVAHALALVAQAVVPPLDAVDTRVRSVGARLTAALAALRMPPRS